MTIIRAHATASGIVVHNDQHYVLINEATFAGAEEECTSTTINLRRYYRTDRLIDEEIVYEPLETGTKYFGRRVEELAKPGTIIKSVNNAAPIQRVMEGWLRHGNEYIIGNEKVYLVLYVPA